MKIVYSIIHIEANPFMPWEAAMFPNRKFCQILFSGMVISTMILSSLSPSSAYAQDGDDGKPQVTSTQEGDGINAESGRISFIGPERCQKLG